MVLIAILRLDNACDYWRRRKTCDGTTKGWTNEQPPRNGRLEGEKLSLPQQPDRERDTARCSTIAISAPPFPVRLFGEPLLFIQLSVLYCARGRNANSRPLPRYDCRSGTRTGRFRFGGNWLISGFARWPRSVIAYGEFKVSRTYMTYGTNGAYAAPHERACYWRMKVDRMLWMSRVTVP